MSKAMQKSDIHIEEIQCNSDIYVDFILSSLNTVRKRSKN